MSEFLSDDWVRDLDASLRAQPSGSSPQALVVQYLVQRSDGSVAAYVLSLGPEGDTARVGETDDADVTFTMDTDTASRISNGAISTEEAFLTGLLDLDGDAGALIAAYRASGEHG